MAAQTRVDFGGILRPSGRLDSATALQPYRGALDERSAAHLLRRAGFGGTPAEIARYAAMSPGDAVESLVRFPSTPDVSPPAVFDRGPYLHELQGLDGIAKKRLQNKLVSSDTAAMQSVRLWWLNRMLTTPTPLQEKMTLYWHGHFTSYINFSAIMYGQNQLFRQDALGNVRDLTHAISKDPAMVLYLNGNTNVAAHPNENYARELMELFTLGVGHYTEDDVRESARAWTGLRFDRFAQTVWFSDAQHDQGTKTFLGRSGDFNGDDVVNIIFAQPQCARFFAASLLSYFVYNDPEPELIDGVAALLRKYDFELAPVMSAIFRSNVFYSDRAYRALVKSPTEFIVGTYKALGLTQIDDSAITASKQMGQVLLQPPNVAGWPGGQNWLTSATMLARQNFVVRMVNSQTLASSSWLQQIPMQPADAARQILSAVVQQDAAPASRFELEGVMAGSGVSSLKMLSPENLQQRIGQAVSLAMAMPAYQLN
ncbi:MAG TPA: DUF1800 domain-containing protein [Candidatus Baltobacteraceae bacterium]|nr:DUF1800 domain-containing protein [Candidatus Baltobacteraceae bacterium]